METKITRPAWMEVHLDRLENNIKEIKRLVGSKEILGVVKADAYGHGVEEVTKTLYSCGVRKFAVATVSEARQLRRRFTNIDILIFGAIQKELAEEIIYGDFVATVSRVEEMKFLEEKAAELEKVARVNLKVDTGMHRLGFNPNEKEAKEIAEACKGENLRIEGAYTHFAISYEDDAFTKAQNEKYDFFIELLHKEGVEIPIQHVCNSAAIIKDPLMHHDLVRAGIILYGVYPFSGSEYQLLNLMHPMEIKAEIVYIREIGPGETVGYGRTFTAKSIRKIATLPIGYADGYPRRLSNRFSVIVKGKKAPIAGFVCMDQMMIDVTGIDCEVGDKVTLMGRDKGEEISAEEFALAYETSPYEILCLWSKRLPKVYYYKGKQTRVVDELLDCQ